MGSLTAELLLGALPMVSGARLAVPRLVSDGQGAMDGQMALEAAGAVWVDMGVVVVLVLPHLIMVQVARGLRGRAVSLVAVARSTLRSQTRFFVDASLLVRQR